MKNSVRITVTILSLVLIALVPAYAQKTSATVNIPFSFTVDDVRLGAGDYLISSSLRPTSESSTFSMSAVPRQRRR